MRGLSVSYYISFELSVQEEHNGAILEAVSLFCVKLLAKTSLDFSWPYLTPRLDKYTNKEKLGRVLLHIGVLKDKIDGMKQVSL